MMPEIKTVLLVEDNVDDEQLTLRAFEKAAVPCLVRVAHDGAEALEILFGPNSTGHLPVLVLLDLRSPRLSGFEFLERIREHETTKNVPVVVLTSSLDDSDISECSRRGANSFVRKPVDFDEFVDVVRQLGQYWFQMNLGCHR